MSTEAIFFICLASVIIVFLVCITIGYKFSTDLEIKSLEDPVEVKKSCGKCKC